MESFVPHKLVASPVMILVLILWQSQHLAAAVTPRFDEIGKEEGLSQSVVTCMLQDQHDFMWFGTEAGLNRYDGYDFEIFRSNDHAALSDDYIYSLAQAKDGWLWIGTKRGGLYGYLASTGELTRIPLTGEGTLGPYEVRAIHVDNEEHLWLGTSRGLIMYNRKDGNCFFYRNQASEPSSLSDDQVTAISSDPQGNLWVATRNGLNRLNPKTGSCKRFFQKDEQGLLDDHVTSLLLESPDRLLVGTKGGLCFYAFAEGKFHQIPFEEPQVSTLHYEIQSLAMGRGRVLWVGTSTGLIRYQLLKPPKQRAYSRYRHHPADPHSLHNNRVQALHEDKNGTLWVGTWGGINRYDREKERFGHVGMQPNDARILNNTQARSFYKAADQTLWVGTMGGLARRDPQTDEISIFQHQAGDATSLSDNKVLAIVPAGDDDSLWLGTFRGLDRFSMSDKRVVASYRLKASDRQSDNQIWAVLPEGRHKLWVGTERAGLNLMDPETGRFRHYRHDRQRSESLSHNWVIYLLRDSEDQLWVATFGGGVNLLEDESSDRFKVFSRNANQPESLTNNKVTCLQEHTDGHSLWVATFGGGLNLLNTETGRCRSWGVAEGMPDNTLYGILQDKKKGDLWISTAAGLACFQTERETITAYTVNDGLQGNEFNLGAYYQDLEGAMYFGGLNGFNTFYPNDIPLHGDPPTMVISAYLEKKESTGLQQLPMLQPADLVPELQLTHQEKSLTFRFAALDYGQPLTNRYAYKLEGFDGNWIETSAHHRHVTYSNLEPGAYTFRVKGAAKSGDWKQDGLRLNVQPAPWKTWWALTLYVWLALGLISLLMIRSHRQLKKQLVINARLQEVDRLKDEFLANTTHELRTPLHGIIGLTESLLGSKCPPPLERDLKMVISSGRRLATLVDDILDFSTLKHEQLSLSLKPVLISQVIDLIYTMSAPLIKNKQVTLINDISPDLPPVLADENRIQQIFYNLVGNAVRFTDAGEVRSSARVDAGFLHIRIQDTGVGIATDCQTHLFDTTAQQPGSRGGAGLGLALTQHLVKLHGGTISLQSEPNKGTTIRFSLPLAQAQENSAMDESSFPPEVPLQEEMKTGDVEQRGPLREVSGLGWPALGEEIFRLLIVDDETVNRQVLINYLRPFRCHLSTAADGSEALSLCQNKGNFDLILLDIMMPGMSGFDVCRELRKHSDVHQLPVIFLTARDQLADLVSAYEAGANDYLTKPVARAELLARVGLHLRHLQFHRTLLDMHREEDTLNHIVKAINREVSLKNLLQAMLVQVVEYVPTAQAATIFLWNEQLQVFEVAASIGFQKEALRGHTFSRQELVSRYLERGMEDVESVTQMRNLVHMEKLGQFPDTRALISIPLALSGQLAGFLILDNFDDSEAFDESNLRQLSRFREHAVWALAKAKLLQQVSEQNRKILAAQEHLVMQEKMASLGFLAAGITHEVKNPASFMQGSIQNLVSDLNKFRSFLFELMNDEPNGEMAEEFNKRLDALADHAEIVREGTVRISGIVRDLSTFARKDDEDKRVDLSGNLLSTVALARANFKEYVRFECDFQEPVQLYCRPSQLNQVFMNLLINACHAIREKQAQSGDRNLGEIIITTTREDGWGVIRFADNGCGIPLKAKAHIFEPFFTTKNDQQGTGLGLSISRNIINAHNGRLEMDSTEAEGTSFTLYLPLNRLPNQQQSTH